MQPLFFAGQPGSGFGWGICNQHLLTELSRLIPVTPMDERSPWWQSLHLPGNLFTPLQDHNFTPATPARGLRNYAYTFFENELTALAVANARPFERIFAGCRWCCERMREKGIGNGVVLIQGVDATVFHPDPVSHDDSRFLVFSGGKFELRKGQDLVLRAVQILQHKFRNLVLVTAWFNHWPSSLQTMAASPHIRFELIPGSWQEQMHRIYLLNGVDPSRVITLPLLSQDKMARVYHLTDVGLFPNRCEGGTNLVMMEYMACGKPVIASYSTGHLDVIHEANALLLKHLKPFKVVTPEGQLTARWQTPTLDEIVAQVEFAYHHRDAIQGLGRQAAEEMKSLTWAKTAQSIVQTMAEP